ncbi:MAG: cobalamin-dependent protein [Actinomycetota bacterium]|nr:cobalamin-dependent protein [Actinomycetota bacterium]
MKILLITPPYHTGVVESAGTWPTLAFGYIGAAAEEAGHEVEIYDAMALNHDLETIKREIESRNPHVVGTTAYTSSYPAASSVLRAAKEVNPSIVTVIGGVHPTFCYEEVLSKDSLYTDYVVRGEGEETFPELLDAIAGKRPPESVRGIAFKSGNDLVVTAARQRLKNLERYRAAWHLFDWSLYSYNVIPGSRLAEISSSRGCNQACSFCSQQKFWERTWRAREPEAVVAEIKYLYENYGINVFNLSDELPTRLRSRWEKFLDLVIELNLPIYFLIETRVADIVRDEDILWKYRKAGIVHIYMGVEATSQERLNYFRKNYAVEQSKRAIDIIREAGAITETAFVVGTPDETPENIDHTLQLAIDYDPDFAYFLALAPWPYADLYNELKPYIEDNDYAKFDFITPVIKPKAMDRDELFNKILDCYRQFYTRKLSKWNLEKDAFRRAYFFKSMELLMENSFLKKYHANLGKIPELVTARKRYDD